MFTQEAQARLDEAIRQNEARIVSISTDLKISESDLPTYLKKRILGTNGCGLDSSLQDYGIEKGYADITLRDLATISPEDLCYSTPQMGAKALAHIAAELVRKGILTFPDALDWLATPGVHSGYRETRYPCEQAKKIVVSLLDNNTVDLTQLSLSKSP